jgi:hypothetical protein
VVPGDAAGADDADVDAVGGGLRAVQDFRPGKQRGREGGRGGKARPCDQRCFQERSSGKLRHIALDYVLQLGFLQIKEIKNSSFATKNEYQSSFAKIKDIAYL